jgi:hypothetical protein
MNAVSAKKVAITLALCVISMVALVGCEPRYEERSYPALPPELEDCKFFYVTGELGESITIVRCPNSHTTAKHQAGKVSIQAAVVEYSSTN